MPTISATSTRLPGGLPAPQHVLLDLGTREQDAAIRAVAQMLRKDVGVLDFAKFEESLLERERVGSTALPNGIAFPHARTDAVSGIVMAAGRSVEGIPFGTTGQLVHVIFVIGTPKEKAREYLETIGAIARKCRDPGMFQQLLETKTPAAFLQVLACKG